MIKIAEFLALFFPHEDKGVAGFLMSFAYRILFCLLLLLTQSGCAMFKDIADVQDIKAWERDIVAQDKMQLDANSLDRMADDKIYFSREASRGGGSFGGGGCGCN